MTPESSYKYYLEQEIRKLEEKLVKEENALKRGYIISEIRRVRTRLGLKIKHQIYGVEI